MALAIVYSRASAGIHAPLVTVETHISRGFPKFLIVGLPAAAVKESRDRVRSALMNSRFEFPRGRITVNLAPADLPKEGGCFDLPIAIGILAASGQIPLAPLAHYEFSAELALSGELRPVRGVLPMVLYAKNSKRHLIVAKENAREASLVKTAKVSAAEHLLDLVSYLRDEGELIQCRYEEEAIPSVPTLDMQDVRGQVFAKRALEIAAAGKHSLLFIGPPGTGKTMLASRLPGIMPSLSEQQALEVAAIASISKSGFDFANWMQLPFRSPHHTTSNLALVGGGRPPRPGEISLTHHGVLFLDELPEFGRYVLEALREPLESGCITISRVAHQTVFPARFQLIAAMNPCPCGYAGSIKNHCQCTHEQIRRYIAKLSGPLLDRLDMQVEVPAVSPDMLSVATGAEETSAAVKERVAHARQRQWQRQNKTNAELTSGELTSFCQLTKEANDLLNAVMKKYELSARVYHRIVKVAQTIADLAGVDIITPAYISEALGYRFLDRSQITH